MRPLSASVINPPIEITFKKQRCIWVERRGKIVETSAARRGRPIPPSSTPPHLRNELLGSVNPWKDGVVIELERSPVSEMLAALFEVASTEEIFCPSDLIPEGQGDSVTVWTGYPKNEPAEEVDLGTLNSQMVRSFKRPVRGVPPIDFLNEWGVWGNGGVWSSGRAYFVAPGSLDRLVRKGSGPTSRMSMTDPAYEAETRCVLMPAEFHAMQARVKWGLQCSAEEWFASAGFEFRSFVKTRPRFPHLYAEFSGIHDCLEAFVTINRLSVESFARCIRPGCNNVVDGRTSHKRKYCSRQCQRADNMAKKRREDAAALNSSVPTGNLP